MTEFKRLEDIFNHKIFADTAGMVRISTRRQLLDSHDVDQTCVQEVIQTGVWAKSNVTLKGTQQLIYYFPIKINLKVEAIMSLLAKPGQEGEFYSGIHYLEKLVELCAISAGEQVEKERVKYEFEIAKLEMTNLFSIVTTPLCIISHDGTIQEINNSMAAMTQKERLSLIGGDITMLLTSDSWETVQKLSGKDETFLKIKQYRGGELWSIIQPIAIEGEILSYLIELKPAKTEGKAGHAQRELYKFEEIKGVSKALQNSIQSAKRVAGGNATILLRGESGTGKEMFAQSIHNESSRKEYPFVAINCAAIPENLLESELFGYEKGAFTGAEKSKAGRFEQADKGTIFLDEIGDMPLPLQAKILRVIQEKAIERIGSGKSIDIDVRIIAATHQNLENLVKAGKFREDLYYRISVIPIYIPPLRERREDLPLLIEYYMSKFSKEMNRPVKRLSEQAVDRLLHYQWPGNIRELQNVVRQFMELEIGDTVTPKSMSAAIFKETGTGGAAERTVPSRTRSSAKKEKDELYRLLDEYGWDTQGKKKAASAMGISLATLYRRMKKHY